MRNSFSLQSISGPRLAAAGWCVLAALVGTVAAQPAGKGRPRPQANPEVKKLDKKMDTVKDAFLRDTEALIKSYEDAGSYDRARTILEALQKLYPQNENIKVKIESLAVQALDASEYETDLDVSKSWVEIGPVQKDRTIRIRVSGDYKLTAGTVTSGPDGLAGDNPDKDLLAHIPFGAVMGAVIPPAGGGGNEKPPRPFLVGASYEKPAERDGKLYLKVNVPPNSKCVGRLQLKVGGIQP